MVPSQQWQQDRPLFEEHRPSAEVLTALEDLLCNDSDICQSYQDVLEAYRRALVATASSSLVLELLPKSGRNDFRRPFPLMRSGLSNGVAGTTKLQT